MPKKADIKQRLQLSITSVSPTYTLLHISCVESNALERTGYYQRQISLLINTRIKLAFTVAMATLQEAKVIQQLFRVL